MLSGVIMQMNWPLQIICESLSLPKCVTLITLVSEVPFNSPASLSSLLTEHLELPQFPCLLALYGFKNDERIHKRNCPSG